MALSSDLKFANNLRNLKLVLACAITLVASHLLLFVLAAVDIAHELRDDTKELNDRIASIVNYNHKIADKLSTQNECDEDQIDKMSQELFGQVYIQQISYKSGSGGYCSIGPMIDYDYRVNASSSIINSSISILYHNKRDNLPVGVIYYRNNYEFLYPTVLPSALLMTELDYKIEYHSTDSGQFHLLVQRDTPKDIGGIIHLVPDFLLTSRYCSKSTQICVTLTHTPRLLVMSIMNWAPVVVCISTIFTICIVAFAMQRMKRYRTTEQRVMNGLQFGSFYCTYQPIVELSSGKLTGVEVLARFRDQFGMLTPDEFIPIIRNSTQTIEFTQFIIHQAMKELEPLNKAPNLGLHINVFPIDFTNEGLWETLISQSQKHQHFEVTVELTEDQTLDFQQVRKFVQLAKKNNIRIAIDDFGTGYANLSHIGYLDCDTLKIDRSFVNGLEQQTLALFNFLWVRFRAFCSPVNPASISGITTLLL